MGSLKGYSLAKANLQALTTALSSDDALAVFQGAAEMVAERARELAPVDELHHDDKEPHLRDTIEVRAYMKGRAPAAIVAVRSGHAFIIEYGGHRQAAQPYIRPAIDELKDAIASQVADGLKAVVEGAVK
jgi:HK97 gp10 family phage protein